MGLNPDIFTEEPPEEFKQRLPSFHPMLPLSSGPPLAPTERVVARDRLLSSRRTHSEADLQACVRDIHKMHDKATTDSLQAVRMKYASQKYGNVSSFAPAHLGPIIID